MSNTQLLRKLDEAIAEKNLLKHPFYQDWQAGKLSRESLQLYAAQYYRHVEAFPQHLRTLAARADESLKAVVLENLTEEENPARPHPRLWRDFASALGVSEDVVTSSPSLPARSTWFRNFARFARTGPLQKPWRLCMRMNRKFRKSRRRRWMASGVSMESRSRKA